jgi:hypothetical protein
MPDWTDNSCSSPRVLLGRPGSHLTSKRLASFSPYFLLSVCVGEGTAVVGGRLWWSCFAGLMRLVARGNDGGAVVLVGEEVNRYRHSGPAPLR